MMRTLHALTPRAVLAAAAALFTCGAQAQALAPEDLYRNLSPSIWLVRAYDGDGIAIQSGSAVVTAPETLLTNCHVLRRAKRISITNDNVLHGARLQYIDVERDLCQITARNLRAPAVPIGDTSRLAVGQKVYALGNPLGIERTLSDGLISALHRTEARQELARIQTSAPISPGSSGGGLFDAQGRLIGITTSQRVEGQNINFAIPIDWMRDLAARSDAALRGVAVPPLAAARPAAPASSGGTPDVNDVEAIPVNAGCKDEYRKYVSSAVPKAFAITDKGRCFWQRTRTASRPEVSNNPDPAVRAMELCVHFLGAGCSLYAVDNNVVFKR
jgi:hypothetical protein